MVWSQVDDIEALRIGIQSEINTYNFYKEALNEITDKDSKELLATLAVHVKKRQKKLEEKYSRLSSNRLLYLNLGKKPHFYNFSSIDGNDLDVLKAAIEHEKNSQIFYEKAAKKNPDMFAAADYLFSAAQNFISIDQKETAKKLLQKIVDNYERSSKATEAKILLAELFANL